MNVSKGVIAKSLGLKGGEWVEVRSKAEILRTLDKNGRLDELPFMPQMFEYCGQKLQIHMRVHKLCGVDRPLGSRMLDTVSLKDVRCNGQAYGGCEMQCMILWKEAWLKRVNNGVESTLSSERQREPNDVNAHFESAECSESDIWSGARSQKDESGEPVYVCQATQLPYATKPLSRWALMQYVEDYVSGNACMSKIVSGLLFRIYHQCEISGIGLGSTFRWVYDVFQSFRGGVPYPWRRGRVPKNSRTPSMKLNLQVGELVRVKEYKEILKTLDDQWKNRGMSYHAELSIHCGKTFRVLQRHQKIMDEKTGRLMVLKNECIVLDGANCEGRYTEPMNCAKSAHPYYREIWLERVPQETGSTSEK